MADRRTDARPTDEPDRAEASGTDEASQSPPARAASQPTAADEPGDESDERESARSKPGVPEPLSTPISSGTIDVENAAFVVLGALLTVALFVRLTGVAL